MKKQIILTIIALLTISVSAIAQSSTTYYQHTKQTVQTADIAAIARYESQISFLYENPTDNQIKEWNNKHKNVLQSLISEYKKDSRFKGLNIPNFMIRDEPGLAYLILISKSIETNDDKQYYFYMYSTMTEQQKMKLYNILYREKYKLNQIEQKYQNKRQQIEDKYKNK
ncbi:MAG: hypothetical protein II945_03260 [Bacteroidales bacterium]|nr:hypothetical protein [Bacteroidales bacterium]